MGRKKKEDQKETTPAAAGEDTDAAGGDAAAPATEEETAPLSKAELKRQAKEEKKRAKAEAKQSKETAKAPAPESVPEPEPEPEPETEPEPLGAALRQQKEEIQQVARPVKPQRVSQGPGSRTIDNVPEAAPKKLSPEEEAACVAAIPRNTSPAQERALRAAAQRGLLHDCTELLDSGVAVDGEDESGFTPLLSAACHGHDAVLSVLLKYGASVSHVDRRRLSALHWAVSQKQASCCVLLIKAAAIEDFAPSAWIDSRGGAAQLTAFLMAAKNQDFACMEMLVCARCDVEARSKHGDDATSLLLAGRKGEEEGRLIAERLRILTSRVAAEAAAEKAAVALRAAGHRVFLSFRDDDPQADVAMGPLRVGLSSKGFSVSEVPRELGHRSSHVLMASVGLEVTATIRGCVAGIVVASNRYAVSEDAAVLETGEHAIGNAALSRFELIELQRQQLPVIVILPSDALAATLDDSTDKLALQLPPHLRDANMLAGKPCVRFGDPRRSVRQLSELVAKLAEVGVLPPEDVTPAGLHEDCVLPETNPTTQAAVHMAPSRTDAVPLEDSSTSIDVSAREQWEKEHAEAIEDGQSKLSAALAEHSAAQAALDKTKKKKDKAAAEAALAAKAATVDEAKAALETIQGQSFESVEVASNKTGQAVVEHTQQQHEDHTERAHVMPSNSNAGDVDGKGRKAGALSERASSLAAGQRVAALTADVHLAPSHWELARAAEVITDDQDANDDAILRDGASSTLSLAKRLRHPELLLQQLQRHERILQRQNDRLYAVETSVTATTARVDMVESTVAATQGQFETLQAFCSRQKGINELRLQQVATHDTRLLALESGLKVAMKRTEAVADLYADVFTQVKRASEGEPSTVTPEQSDARYGETQRQNDSSDAANGESANMENKMAAGVSGLQFETDVQLETEWAASHTADGHEIDGLHAEGVPSTTRTPGDSEHTIADTPSNKSETLLAQPDLAVVVWTIETDPGQYVHFPQRYASRLTTAYFKRERMVELRSTPKPQALDATTYGSLARETALAREWSNWWTAFGSAPMQVDLCAMRMEEIYPTTAQLRLEHTGRKKGWVLFGSWSGVLVKPLDDEIVSKFSSVQRIEPNNGSMQTTKTSTSTDASRSSSYLAAVGTNGKPSGSNKRQANATSQEQHAVGYRRMEAMGANSDGSLEHTLRELSSDVEDVRMEQVR